MFFLYIHFIHIREKEREKKKVNCYNDIYMYLLYDINYIRNFNIKYIYYIKMVYLYILLYQLITFNAYT